MISKHRSELLDETSVTGVSVVEKDTAAERAGGFCFNPLGSAFEAHDMAAWKAYGTFVVFGAAEGFHADIAFSIFWKVVNVDVWKLLEESCSCCHFCGLTLEMES